MSVNLECFFQDYTNPLKRVDLVEMVPNETYITLDGSRIKLTEERDIIIEKSSPLVEGATVNSFVNPELSLKLFYKLLDKQ